MIVIVPFYNCEKWIERALYSIASQRYTDYRVLVINDASTDNSQYAAERVCDMYENFKLIRLTENCKCPLTIWLGMEYAPTQNIFGVDGVDPEEPIFILDGDDYLPHDNVLGKIAEVYEDPDVWMTYGSYTSEPFDPLCEPAQMYGADVIAQRNYRNCGGGNLFNHPLTWRAWFFNKLNENDLKDPMGQWFRAGYDRLFMYPMLEMATEYDGHCHWRYLPDILYAYNSINPISDVHANMNDCVYVANTIIKYPVKEPVHREL